MVESFGVYLTADGHTAAEIDAFLRGLEKACIWPEIEEELSD